MQALLVFYFFFFLISIFLFNTSVNSFELIAGKAFFKRFTFLYNLLIILFLLLFKSSIKTCIFSAVLFLPSSTPFAIFFSSFSLSFISLFKSSAFSNAVFMFLTFIILVIASTNTTIDKIIITNIWILSSIPYNYIFYKWMNIFCK